MAAYRLGASLLDPTNAFDITARQPDRILEVPAGNEQLRFEFTALGLSDPRNIYFRYRLEGSDAEWVNAGQERFAQYSHIPPGSYSFSITACEGDGVWSAPGTVLKVQVLPHFWQTWWFRIAALLVCIAAVAGVARHWATKKLQRQLEEARQASAIERERTRIAKDIHDDLGANLTEITLLSELAQSAEAPAAEARADVRAIAARARELTRSLDATVWAVDPVKDSLESLVSYTCAYAEDYLKLAGIRCRLDLPHGLADRPLAPETRHNLFLVTKEALHNIVKHSGASEAQIQIEGQNGVFKLAIVDNGTGFQPQPFDGSQNGFISKDRRGNGLQNMRKRIEDIGGSYVLTSEPGKGTRVEISVPLQ
jgi:signal transduction histidine kinase